MKTKDLLKLIEQACNNNIITHHDLIDLGLDIQRKKLEKQRQIVEQIFNQPKEENIQSQFGAISHNKAVTTPICKVVKLYCHSAI